MAAASPVLPANEEDWAQVERAWRDWRASVNRHYDERSNVLLEQAWAAGLLDSEAGRANGAESAEKAPEARPLLIRQPGGERGRVNLMRFQQAIGGAGRVTGPHSYGVGASYFVWQAVTEDDVEKVWLALGPFLGPAKFRAFRKALVLANVWEVFLSEKRLPATRQDGKRRWRKSRQSARAENRSTAGEEGERGTKRTAMTARTA